MFLRELQIVGAADQRQEQRPFHRREVCPHAGPGAVGKYTMRSFVDFGKGKVRFDGTSGFVAHGGGVLYEASTGLLAQERRDGRWTVQKNTKGQFGKSVTVDRGTAEDMVDGLIPFPAK